MSVTPFGRFGDVEMLQVRLRSGSGVEASILTWGAVLRDLVVPARGGPQRVVLGLDTLDDYVAHSAYFGPIVGRYGNRIGGARFRLGGREIGLTPNEGGNQLHGGPAGFGRRPWSIVGHDATSVQLALTSADGDMGWPGRLTAVATYELLESATLRITLEAFSDAPTPVNLVPHNYFNLDGSADARDHRLAILASHVTPTDAALIPTGAVSPVAGGPYDFRLSRTLRSANPQSTYDINYVLDRPGGIGAGLDHAATLASERSGLALDLWTTEPGLQFYDSHKLAMTVPGLGGARYGRYGGVVLEPQRFPDGPNHAHFPPSLTLPGQVSRQMSEYRFRSEG